MRTIAQYLAIAALALGVGAPSTSFARTRRLFLSRMICLFRPRWSSPPARR